MNGSNGRTLPTGYRTERYRDLELAYIPGSHASGVIQQFAKHADQVLNAVIRQLHLPSRIATQPAPIRIVCREGQPDGSDEASSDPTDGEVFVVLTPTVPAFGLARELTRVVLYRVQAAATNTDVSERSVSITQPQGLDFLIGGIARAVAARVEARLPFSSRSNELQSADDLCRQVGRENDWVLPIYDCMIGGLTHAPTEESYWAMAESFGDYLLTRDGPKACMEFIRETAGGDISYASAVAYGKYVEALTVEWIEFQLRRGTGRRTVGWLNFLGRSLPYFRPYPWLVAWCMLLVFATSTTAQFAPFLVRDITDTVAMKDEDALNEPWAEAGRGMEGVAHVLGQDPDEIRLIKVARILRLVLALLGANLISAGTQVLLVYYVNVLGQNVLRDFRLRYLDRVNGLSATNFNRTSTGDLQARFLSDLVRLADPMTQIVSYSIYHIVFLVAVVWAMFLLSWQLTLVLIAASPLYVAIAAWLGPKLQRATRTRQERLAQLNSDLKQMVDAHPLIQIGNLQRFLRRRSEPGIEHSRRIEIRTDFYTGLFAETLSMVDQFFAKLVYLVGGILAVFGIITVGTILAFVTQTQRGIARMHSLLNIYRYVALSAAVLQRVEEVLKFEVEPLDHEPEGARLRSNGRPSSTVEFDGVWFSYNGADQILRDVSLKIPAGGNVAFVGPTGSGKSTLVSMVPRFYDPTRGEIRIDGVPTTSIPLTTLRAEIGMVSQDTFLFNMSIRENIGLGKLGATDEEIEAAAKRARIHNFIMSLPSGYHTLVGERGSRLSGGQRQRLAVARALLRNPSILILDEATSALDAETEREILDELEESTRDKTVISVTHRLTLAMRCDRIFVVDQGEIVEAGTHAELMLRKGVYRKLFEDQNHIILEAMSNGHGLDNGVRETTESDQNEPLGTRA
ncbi:MAG TPA: ABC transporter ATP-binding protein [Chloroflexota bacterium]|nr:ABC transporter ATP-binding protein [Chloroflexota bacterium]